MRGILKATAAAILTVGAAIGPSLAQEHEVHDISWNLEHNYNGGGQTVCVAENYNDYPVTAQFSVFPGGFGPDGAPLADQAPVTLKPYAETTIFSWAADYAGPRPTCSLMNYSVSAQ